MQKLGLSFATFIIILFGYGLYSWATFSFENKEEKETSAIITDNGQQPWTIQDAISQININSVIPSPNGKYTLIEEEAALTSETKPPFSEISLVNNETREKIWRIPGDWMCFSAQWSPDGKYVSFLKFNEKNETSLWVTSVDKFQERQVTPYEPGVGGYLWSPDSKKIALVKKETKEIGDDISIEVGSEKTTVSLSVFPLTPSKYLAPAAEVQLTDYKFPEKLRDIREGITWSPDSEGFTFVGKNLKTNKEGLFHLILKSQEISLLREERDPLYPYYSFHENSIAYVADDEEVTTFPIKKRRVFVMNLSSKKVQKLSSTFGEDPVLLGWTTDQQHLLVHEGYKTIARLYKLSLYGGKIEILNTDENSFVSSVSLNKSGNNFGFILESLNTAPTASISPVAPFNPRPVLREFFLTLPLKSEIIHWRSFDGIEIEGIFIYPIGYREGNSYPLLVAVHDGPYAAWQQQFMGNCYNGLPLSPAVFASQGYAVLLPNIRGSSNYGINFARAIQKDLGGADFKDIMAGVDSLITKGIANPEKLAIWGWGYGGYLAVWATTQTDRFKASIVGAGIIDFITFPGTTGKQGFLESYLGGPFWENKNLWLSRSPLAHGEKINTPILMQYGLKDEDYTPYQGKELIYPLRRRNIPLSVKIFTLERHTFALPASRKYGMETSLDWLNKYLNLSPKTIIQKTTAGQAHDKKS